MSIVKARSEVGLYAPSAEFKRMIWSQVSMPAAKVEDGYIPIPEVERVHFHPARIRDLAGAARLGKSLFIAMEAVPWAFYSSLVWLLGPDYAQTRQEFHYIMEALVSIGATQSSMISMPQTKSQPCSLETMWGCQIETLTTQDPEKIAGKAPDIIFLCEPGQIQDGVLERTLERLTTKRGPLVMAGTFEENTYTWFQDVWKRWRKWPNKEDARSFSIPMWANTYTFPDGRNDSEIKRLEATIPRDAFLRRVCGIPTPSRRLILGDIWRPEKDSKPYHVGWFPYDNKKPVELFIDPGWGSDSYYYVGAIQSYTAEDGLECHNIIDEIAVQYNTHKQVAQLAMNKNWWAGVTGAVIEPWGGLQHPLGNISAVEAWQENTLLPNIRGADRLGLDERVNDLRDLLYDPIHKIPRIFFNERTTERIRWEIAHWRRRTIKSNASRPSKPDDLHCDGIKALLSWITDHKTQSKQPNRPKVHDVVGAF